MAAVGVAAMAVADTADRRAAMVDRAVLGQYLNSILSDATIAELPNHYRGKVRDNYDLPDGRRIIIATDRLSAFDRILTAIPLKGQVLTGLARFWFEETRALCPNHVIGYPDPNVLVCRRLDIMPVEIVVRDYLTGSTATSIWPMYKTGRRDIYGIAFPDGLRENQKLPATIITPTTKAFDGGHDDAAHGRGDRLARGLLTEAQWRRGLAAGAGALRPRPSDRPRPRPDPGRHQIRVRLRPGRRDRSRRRNPYPRQQPLLARRELRAPLRRRRAARHSRQGLCPALGRRTLRSLQRARSRRYRAKSCWRPPLAISRRSRLSPASASRFPIPRFRRSPASAPISRRFSEGSGCKAVPSAPINATVSTPRGQRW